MIVRMTVLDRLCMDHGNDKERLFIAIYDDLSPAIFKHCFFRLSNRERALELTQEVFMRLWEKLSANETISSPSALLYTLSRNLIIDEYRRKKAVSLDQLQDSGFDAPTEDDERITRAAEVSVMLKAIQAIPEKYREVLILRYVDGLTPSEIGKI